MFCSIEIGGFDDDEESDDEDDTGDEDICLGMLSKFK